jgi:hypothetical protein
LNNCFNFQIYNTDLDVTTLKYIPCGSNTIEELNINPSQLVTGICAIEDTLEEVGMGNKLVISKLSNC